MWQLRNYSPTSQFPAWASQVPTWQHLSPVLDSAAMVLATIKVVQHFFSSCDWSRALTQDLLTTLRGDFCHKKYCTTGPPYTPPCQVSPSRAHLPISQDPAAVERFVVSLPATCLLPTSMLSFKVQRDTQKKAGGTERNQCQNKQIAFKWFGTLKMRGCIFSLHTSSSRCFSFVPMTVGKWTHLPHLTPCWW